jgi:nucleoside phosphorylase
MMNDGKGPGSSTLLCFAHKGEAQSFFKRFSLKSHQRFKDVWACPEFMLCLTGEGMDQAMTKIGLLIGAHPEFKEVINLGVVGAVRDDVLIHQLVQVRTVYGEDRFHSFELDGDTDLLTTAQRVLDPLMAKKLRAFAPVVDRELWAIARVCKEARINLRALKIISDKVEDQQKEVCAVVKEQALFFSEQLLEAYLHLPQTQLEPIANQIQNISLFTNEFFHFSLVQKRQLIRLLEQLDCNEEEIADFSQTVIEMKKRPKDRARILLEELNRRLSPLEAQIKEALQACAKRDRDLGIEVQYDSQLEDLTLQIKVQAENPNQWQQNLRALETLRLERYWKFLKGEIDV